MYAQEISHILGGVKKYINRGIMEAENVDIGFLLFVVCILLA